MQVVTARYAKALFEIARQEKIVPILEKEAQTLSELLKESEDLNKFLASPVMPTYQKRTVARSLWDQRIHKLLFQLIDLLVCKRRENLLKDILKQFLQMCFKDRGLIQVQFRSAEPLSETHTKEIQQKLKTILKKEIELIHEVQPELLGGFVLRIGNKEMDKSLSAQLSRIKQHLIHHD
ncbi:MAG: ATP synthase F1 subunit delta [Cytophagales bacterium]|nr:ATP synthase F1 subunit delta [Cytophagales bacterium]